MDSTFNLHFHSSTFLHVIRPVFIRAARPPCQDLCRSFLCFLSASSSAPYSLFFTKQPGFLKANQIMAHSWLKSPLRHAEKIHSSPQSPAQSSPCRPHFGPLCSEHCTTRAPFGLGTHQALCHLSSFANTIRRCPAPFLQVTASFPFFRFWYKYYIRGQGFLSSPDFLYVFCFCPFFGQLILTRPEILRTGTHVVSY